MSNFESAYNLPPKLIHKPTMYIPISSYSTSPNRSSSPLFRRSASPPSRSPISTRSNLKFNFDLYKMNEYDDYPSPHSRSRSPSPSTIMHHHHHHPIHSRPPSSTSNSQTLSKLRQLNDDLCHTLARSDIPDQRQRSSPPPHHHIHHYPVSQHPYDKYRSRSTSEERLPPTEFEVSPKIHKARVTYKVHIPHGHRQEHVSTSDIYSSDDSMTVDLYPTRDQGFVKQIRNHSDNRSPWVVDGTSIRRSSYLNTNTSRRPQAPKGPYYGDKPIKTNGRLARGKEHPPSRSRHQSPYVTSRSRPDSAPLYESDPVRESAVSFSNTTPAWRSSGYNKRPKYISSHGSSSRSKRSLHESSWDPSGITRKEKYIRAYDPRSESPSSGTREPMSHRISKVVSQRSSTHYEPFLKRDYETPTGTQSEPVLQQKTIRADRVQIRSGDPKLKKRIAKTESKVKSAWEPTVTSLTQSTAREPKLPIPHPVKRTTITTPPKSKVKSVPSEPTAPVKKPPPRTTNTDRSPLNDVPRKPMFESTPRNQSVVDGNNDSVTDLLENDSETSEKHELPRLPVRVEKKPTSPPQQPKKPLTEPPKTSVPEPKTKATVKDGVLIRGNENLIPSTISKVNNHDDDEESSEGRSVQPTPPPPKVPAPKKKVPPPKANKKDDESVAADDIDENDREVAGSFDFSKWLNGASSAILDPSKRVGLVIPSPPPKPRTKTPPPRKEKPASPPRRKEPPPAESPDHNLYKPPFGPKKKDPKPATPLPPLPATTGDTGDVDDFFN